MDSRGVLLLLLLEGRMLWLLLYLLLLHVLLLLWVVVLLLHLRERGEPRRRVDWAVVACNKMTFFPHVMIG